MKTLQIFLLLLALVACKKEKKNIETAEDNTTNTVQKNNEWETLFDGETFKGWHVYLTDSISDEWSVEDGAMMFNPKEGRTEGGKNLISDKTYTNFKLLVEWKISKGGNSGIFWSVKEDTIYKEAYETGPEIQILDHLNYPDPDKKHHAGALFGLVGSKQEHTNPIGEWNTFVISINHKTNKGKVWLNKVKIIEFPVNGKNWNEMVEHSKFKDWDGFGKFTTGKIGLQDHGSKVWFRNIKIQELQ